jgi:hypothetical protein
MDDDSTSTYLSRATSDNIMPTSTTTMIDTATLLSGITAQINHLNSEWKQDIGIKFEAMATKIDTINTTFPDSLLKLETSHDTTCMHLSNLVNNFHGMCTLIDPLDIMDLKTTVTTHQKTIDVSELPFCLCEDISIST